MTVFSLKRWIATARALACAPILLAACGCPWTAPGRIANLQASTNELAVSQADDPAETPTPPPATFQSPLADERLAALSALKPGDPLPAEAAALRNDPDRRVRKAALTALAEHSHPDRGRWLGEALEDQEYVIREAAVQALGKLPAAEGRTLLEKALEDQGDRVRAEAVAQLAVQPGSQEIILRMAKDKSFRVRSAVADALARWPNQSSTALARALLADPSPEVQRRTVEAVGHWEPQQSGPLLLAAMASPVVVTRTEAAKRLAAVWPAAAAFAPMEPPDRRLALLAQLEPQFVLAFGRPPAVQPRSTAADQIAAVEQSLAALSSENAQSRTTATHALVACGPALVSMLEQIQADRQQPLAEAVYREVLPAVSPAFDQLRHLAGGDLIVRRRAAADLAVMSIDRPLATLAVARIADLAAREGDSLVWQNLLAAVANSPSEPAARLACTAIGHPAPEVRRRACVYLGEHPDPRYAPVLLPALEDRSEEVVRAAAVALGRFGPATDPQPLRRLLAAPSEAVRFEAAVALGRLRDSAAPGAMERLSFSSDPTIRRRVALAMGELGDPSFAPTLVRLLDDQHGIRRAALDSLPQVVGRDVAAAEPPSDFTRRAERWKRWLAENRR